MQYHRSRLWPSSDINLVTSLNRRIVRCCPSWPFLFTCFLTFPLFRSKLETVKFPYQCWFPFAFPLDSYPSWYSTVPIFLLCWNSTVSLTIYTPLPLIPIVPFTIFSIRTAWTVFRKKKTRTQKSTHWLFKAIKTWLEKDSEVHVRWRGGRRKSWVVPVFL